MQAGSLLDVALYMSFFPKVISGPIVLWRDFEKEIKSRTHSLDKFFEGMQLMMVGFAKKVIIADTLGSVVSAIITDCNYGIDSITAVLGGLCYMIQLYYDFSGYSDIAIGLAKMFGFNIKKNFDYPYTSLSVTEFWRRWHISLGTWFREYLYIPLGGNRKGNVYLNLFIVFMATGLWHGASWNYILWGLCHAVLMVLERKIRNANWYIKIPTVIKWSVTAVFVYFTWIVFMTPSIATLKTYFACMLGRYAQNINFAYQYYFDNKIICVLIIGIVGAFLGRILKRDAIVKCITDNKILFCVKEIITIVVFIVAIIFMVNSTYSPFLYFQF